MTDANPKYRDSIFRAYFNEPIRLLSLCNAVLNTRYNDPTKLEINTLEGIFFDRQKNDISCSIDNNFLVLVEHQTTVNNNMPFRFLSYIAELLNSLVKDKKTLYKEKLLTFPSPKFFVLYDGNKNEPLKKIMRLSDAFNGDSSSLELVVTSFNINFSLHSPLLDKCPYLKDYSTLIGKIKSGLTNGLTRHDAIIQAVKFCISNNIMKSYLLEHSEEVFNMLALEWNLDDALQARFDDGIEQGRSEEREALIIKMLRKGKSFDEIHEFIDIPIQRIQELAQNISTK